MEVRVNGLSKAYGAHKVLQGVSFTAGKGVTCIMAPSGGGKTTLLRILLGLEPADGGTVSLPQHCRWAVVFQEDRLLEHLDALGNLHFALGPDLREEEALALLRELGLEDVGKKRVRDYSGGMKRRLALARALLAHSDALILDEPFSGLDEESRRKALRAVGRAAADQPVLLVTHEEEDAVALQATIIKLNKPAG